jgi:transcription factor C subunit 6
VRAVAWIRTPPLSGNGGTLIREDPTVIASGGYDGMECVWDIREMGGNVMNRTRGAYIHQHLCHRLIACVDVINSMAFSPFVSGLVTIDHENIIKTFSLSPATLGKGHELFEPAGPVWVSLGLLSQLLEVTFVVHRALQPRTITRN